MREKICLIMPCYNEAKRLDFTKINDAKNCNFLFVNDGSTDNTLEILNSNIKKNIYILNLKKNVGKAEAVRRGFLYIKNLPIFPEVDWIGYWDADLATPLYELDNFLTYGKIFDADTKAIFGSRILKLGSNIKRSSLRHLLGRVFATMVGIVFDLKTYDSQCGAKLFRKELIDKYFSKPFVSRWIFDIEILLRMKDIKIIEYPLLEWKDVCGGKIKIFPTAIMVLLDIFRLWYHKKIIK